ncbi:hypothetical protein COJ96_25050 [Bacillus sp. AFS073361]|uniref:hypothetical protein n=1 Tax=Bacillus sp. AFS073361 TaxID=2033511 RepID=UPI000BF2AADD|nr:hypothetical protein [Bacillus sp. AFS073361]PFP22911.1 hypothetical protein COJ96_25050 [Bacillus sp. AFS073361]
MGRHVEKKHNISCKGDCLCRILKKYIQSVVTIRTKSGDILMGELQRVTKDCCVNIIEQEMVTPFVSDRLTVIRCEDIESFSVELSV